MIIYIASKVKHRRIIYINKIVKHTLQGFIHVVFIKIKLDVTMKPYSKQCTDSSFS